ncbi:unnamed protein product [Caenorhabditis brenneri]
MDINHNIFIFCSSGIPTWLQDPILLEIRGDVGESSINGRRIGRDESDSEAACRWSRCRAPTDCRPYGEVPRKCVGAGRKDFCRCPCSYPWEELYMAEGFWPVFQEEKNHKMPMKTLRQCWHKSR